MAIVHIMLKILLTQYSSATHCGIQVLTRNAFMGIYRLQKLLLDHNEIERIETKTFRGMLVLHTM